MKINYISARWKELAHKAKTMDEEFEYDVVNAVKRILECIEPFEAGTRLFTRPSDLHELIHWFEYGVSTVKHSKGYFELTPEEKAELRD